MKTLIAFASLSVFTLPPFAFACKVAFPKHAPTAELNDPFFHILKLSPQCPTNIHDLTQRVETLGLTITPAMVANRGFHNPSQGSFSFFEEITGALPNLPTIEKGQFFLGHFTSPSSSRSISLDQANGNNKLLVELLAWDFKKQVFNFYELIGGAPNPRWFYRGDSIDIWSDNQNLFRARKPSEPLFGQRLRCSACHTSGGPIMKELISPHNDWWRKERPLWLANLKPDADVRRRIALLEDASEFASSVLKGIRLLQTSNAKRKVLGMRSLQEVLRPLFCEQEINLVSASEPLTTSGTTLTLPSRIFQNPIFGEQTLDFKKSTYTTLLKLFNMRFPETKLMDADHPWLAPVKGEADQVALIDLVRIGLIDEEFASDVLAVDMRTPLFSKARCALLQAVPDKPFFPSWKTEFMNRLQTTPSMGAQELLINIKSSERNQRFFRRQAEKNLLTLQSQLHQKEGSELLFQRLIESRQSVFESEISKNPMGQILEPGFRVVFPVPSARY